ncbi:MAG TPA: STAS domain-containing protein [Terriglobales bacterium]|nr:STAS domain-containing protein [Terriglobales bacterium]
MPLQIKVLRLPQATVVECIGRVVFGDETTLLRSEVKKLIAENPLVVLDFAQVRDIDSGGVGTLLAILTSAVSAGGTLKLARINEKVRQTLSITRLLGVLRAYDTVELAVAAMPSDAKPATGTQG